MDRTPKPFDADAFAASVRGDLPILNRRFDGRPLTYLDSAATSLTPDPIVDAIAGYYRHCSANVLRGNHALAEEATNAFDQARVDVAAHVNADPLDVIFVANTTDAINVVATSLQLTRADRVLVPVSEHHSNALPWLRSATVETLPIDDQGYVDPDEVRRRLDRPARLLAIGHASNVTGAIQPIAEITRIARERGVPVLVDGAQAAPHLRVDVEALGCDYYAFSAHKMLGPTGIGALWGRADLLEAIDPARLGGGTVVRVLEDSYQLKALPHRLEGGTPNIAGAIGFGAAARYLAALGMGSVERHEEALTARLLERLSAIDGIRVLGPTTSARRLGVVSMTFARASADRVAIDLSTEHAIMVRQGQHCAQPLFHHFKEPSALRASTYVYTTSEEVDRFADTLERRLRARGPS